MNKERLIGLIESCKRDINYAETLKHNGNQQMPNMMCSIDEYIDMRLDAMTDFEQQLEALND